MNKQLWRHYLLGAILIFSANIINSQVSRDNFNIIFENNYDNDQAGSYRTSDFAGDWNITNGSSPVGNLEIMNDDAAHQKMMRAYYPAGTMQATNEHGFTWYSYFPSKKEELYFSYDVRFKPGFQWVLGGKIPGIVGGGVTSGKAPTSTSGFSTRLVWKSVGNLLFYVYHHDQAGIYGDIFDFEGFRFETGKWYNLTMRVVLNSVVNGTAKADGILEGYVNGKLMFQKAGFRFRLNETIKIERMYICSFFGGNTPEWVAARDEWIDTDNYVAYTYSDNASNVPRGFQLSNFDKFLIHPYYNFSGNEPQNPGSDIPLAPSGLKYSLLSKSSVTLNWNDNSTNEDGFRIYRSLSEVNGFTEVGQISANSTSFTDNSLNPGINYFYQLLAYNEHGNSPYTPVYGITAPLLDLPSAPSEFYSTAQSSTSVDLAWNDNSSREQGFKLYRSISETAGFAEVASCEANETSCTDRSLQSSATYFYRLRAFNTDGFSDYTPTIRVTTLVPGTPEPPPTEDTGNHNHGSIVYIDPENKSDQSANGSVEHPYNSWTNLVWIEGHSYLQKRGTTTTVGMIQIGANNVTLGSYGEGAIPVLNSTSTTYMISGFEKSGIEINNLSLNAPNAVSAVYFLGSSNDSIIIDHCTITGSRSAIKVMDASTLMVKYNILKGEQEGVFSTAEINVVNYNIFENSHSAINIMSNLSKASIFNNVFYNNTESVAVSYSDLTLYNNIFYLAENDHTALKLGTDKIKSDNNIYYPEQPGFISIGGKAYNNLDELQKTMKIDLNSFSSDPMFSDYVNENFRLKSKSPAINSGKNVQTTIDLEGTKVPLFGNTDIGAYEFSGNVSTPGELNNGEKINLKVFPNPTNGQITVEASLNEDNLSQEEPTLQSHELKVLDITGKILFTKNISFSNSVYQEKLDLSEFKSGLYFVIIRTADKIFKEKILLSR